VIIVIPSQPRIIDLIALSAIFCQLNEYRLTLFRLAVLVSNILVLVHLVLILTNLFRICFKKKKLKVVEISVSEFLPVYMGWIIIVVLGFPVIFNLK